MESGGWRGGSAKISKPPLPSCRPPWPSSAPREGSGGEGGVGKGREGVAASALVGAGAAERLARLARSGFSNSPFRLRSGGGFPPVRTGVPEDAPRPRPRADSRAPLG